jgi:hypothetical protein
MTTSLSIFIQTRRIPTKNATLIICDPSINFHNITMTELEFTALESSARQENVWIGFNQSKRIAVFREIANFPTRFRNHPPMK